MCLEKKKLIDEIKDLVYFFTLKSAVILFTKMF